MREIKAEQITKAVRDLCIEANCHLPADIKDRITLCSTEEPFPIAQNILAIIGCQIIDTSGILDSKNIAGMKTIPDNKLFITNIDNPDNFFDCDAYFTKMILPQ